MNALTTPQRQIAIAPTIALMDPAQFDQMQRVGKMLALSPLFPAHLRQGSAEERIANGVLVMNMAVRLHEDPLTVAQNIYFVGGRPGWNTTYRIAKANMHGVFKDPIDWDVAGKGDNLSVTAFAVLSGTGKRVEMTADMAMAQAEGWTKNAKYKSIPETMLRYRSAAALIRLYCPEVIIGLPAGIEVETEMRDVTPASAREPEPAGLAAMTAALKARAEEDAQTVIDRDPETGEVTQIEDQRHAQQTIDPPKEKASAPTARRQPKPRTDDTPYGKGGPQGSEQAALDMGSNTEATDLEIGVLADKLDGWISGDLNDGADLNSTLDLYAAQLDQVKAADPERHTKMLRSYEDFVAQQ